jgi:hypothetical protein
MELFCPFPAARNPATTWAENHTRNWAYSWGLFANLADYERFTEARFTELMGRAYPTVEPDLLTLIADWNSWTFLVDTQLDDHDLGRNPAQLGQFASITKAIMGDQPCQVDPTWPPLLHALADLIARLRDYATPAWLRRFRQNVEATLTACVHEARYRSQRILVNEARYLQVRPDTSGAACFLDLIELAAPTPLPDALRTHPQIERLVALTTEAIFLVNDLASADKERHQGDGNNLVLIAEREHSLSAERAAEYVYSRYLRVIDTFMRARMQLPTCTAPVDQHLHDYVTGLGHWIRANVDWSALTGRYQPEVLLQPLMREVSA